MAAEIRATMPSSILQATLGALAPFLYETDEDLPAEMLLSGWPSDSSSAGTIDKDQYELDFAKTVAYLNRRQLPSYVNLGKKHPKPAEKEKENVAKKQRRLNPHSLPAAALQTKVTDSSKSKTALADKGPHLQSVMERQRQKPQDSVSLENAARKRPSEENVRDAASKRQRISLELDDSLEQTLDNSAELQSPRLVIVEEALAATEGVHEADGNAFVQKKAKKSKKEKKAKKAKKSKDDIRPTSSASSSDSTGGARGTQPPASKSPGNWTKPTMPAAAAASLSTPTDSTEKPTGSSRKSHQGAAQDKGATAPLKNLSPTERQAAAAKSSSPTEATTSTADKTLPAAGEAFLQSAIPTPSEKRSAAPRAATAATDTPAASAPPTSAAATAAQTGPVQHDMSSDMSTQLSTAGSRPTPAKKTSAIPAPIVSPGFAKRSSATTPANESEMPQPTTPADEAEKGPVAAPAATPAPAKEAQRAQSTTPAPAKEAQRAQSATPAPVNEAHRAPAKEAENEPASPPAKETDNRPSTTLAKEAEKGQTVTSARESEQRPLATLVEEPAGTQAKVADKGQAVIPPSEAEKRPAATAEEVKKGTAPTPVIVTMKKLSATPGMETEHTPVDEIAKDTENRSSAIPAAATVTMRTTVVSLNTIGSTKSLDGATVTLPKCGETNPTIVPIRFSSAQGSASNSASKTPAPVKEQTAVAKMRITGAAKQSAVTKPAPVAEVSALARQSAVTDTQNATAPATAATPAAAAGTLVGKPPAKPAAAAESRISQAANVSAATGTQASASQKEKPVSPAATSGEVPNVPQTVDAAETQRQASTQPAGAEVQADASEVMPELVEAESASVPTTSTASNKKSGEFIPKSVGLKKYILRLTKKQNFDRIKSDAPMKLPTPEDPLCDQQEPTDSPADQDAAAQVPAAEPPPATSETARQGVDSQSESDAWLKYFVTTKGLPARHRDTKSLQVFRLELKHLFDTAANRELDDALPCADPLLMAKVQLLEPSTSMVSTRTSQPSGSNCSSSSEFSGSGSDCSELATADGEARSVTAADASLAATGIPKGGPAATAASAAPRASVEPAPSRAIAAPDVRSAAVATEPAGSAATAVPAAPSATATAAPARQTLADCLQRPASPDVELMFPGERNSDHFNMHFFLKSEAPDPENPANSAADPAAVATTAATVASDSSASSAAHSATSPYCAVSRPASTASSASPLAGNVADLPDNPLAAFAANFGSAALAAAAASAQAVANIAGWPAASKNSRVRLPTEVLKR